MTTKASLALTFSTLHFFERKNHFMKSWKCCCQEQQMFSALQFLTFYYLDPAIQLSMSSTLSTIMVLLTACNELPVSLIGSLELQEPRKKACVNLKSLLSKAVISIHRHHVASRTWCPSQKATENLNNVSLHNQNMKIYF